MDKVQPSEELRKGIHAFPQNMVTADSGAEALTQLVRLATGLMVQQGLEAEQADFIGRDHYERGGAPRISQRLPPRPPGYGR